MCLTIVMGLVRCIKCHPEMQYLMQFERSTCHSKSTSSTHLLCVQSTRQPPPNLNNNLWILKYSNILDSTWELQQNYIKKTKIPSLAVLIFLKSNGYVVILLFKKIKKRLRSTFAHAISFLDECNHIVFVFLQKTKEPLSWSLIFLAFNDKSVITL